jgi:hypothetical protein
MPRDTIAPALLKEYKTQSGQALGALTEVSPVLLVFLRHFG